MVMEEVTCGNRELHMVPRTRLHVVTMCHIRLHKLICGYIWLYQNKSVYRELHMVTPEYKCLQRVWLHRVACGYSGLHVITMHYLWLYKVSFGYGE